jgi:aminoglycoside phosphotransferase family enzyme/predicted kinase
MENKLDVPFADVTQAALFAQMAHPDFYPHSVSAVTERETHISKVFLTGDVVYKIKKPLNLEFLDFTTLEKRRYFCLQEITLNRRLTRNVYLDVVPICFDGTFNMKGQGEIVEYAVKMRQLMENDSMTQRLREDRLGRFDIENLAYLLTDFYAQASPDTSMKDAGAWNTVCQNCEENFRQLLPFSKKFFDERLFQIISAASRSFLNDRKSLFDDRVRNRNIRDCHGDLKTGHVYFTAEGIQIIDCIEFNERFRFQDIASDLAFLAMDIDFEGRFDMANMLVDDYARRSKDFEVFVLLDFYKCYRALVRCKINCIRMGEGGLGAEETGFLINETAKYLDLAYQYATRFARPFIWVVCGPPASGKSAISEELARAFGIDAINSDVVRKELFGVPRTHHLDLAPETSIYSPSATSLTYGRLLLMAQEEIEKGRSVILDATFSKAGHRAEALRLARDKNIPIIFVECVLSDDLLKKRLAAREKTTGVSDARLGHFDYFKNRFEPLTDIPDAVHVRIDTAEPMDECMVRILSSARA